MERDRKENQYWMDRKGKCYKFKGDEEDIVSIHYEIAKTIYPDSDKPDDVLMKLGWILVGSSVYNCPIIHKKPTQAQINKLYELNLYERLCFSYNNTYPNYSEYGILYR